MPNHNHVTLIGHTTRDCDRRSLADGKSVVKTGLAVNGWKPGDVMFIDLTAWNKTGDALAKVSKGQAVGVVGRLVLEQWDDKSTGAKRSKHSVTVDQVILMGGGRRDEAAPVQDERVANEGVDRQEQVAAQEQSGEIPF